MLQDDLESSTFRNRALTPNMKVLMALRFYASGSFQGVIADTFGLSQPSVSRAISDVSTALVKRAGNYITFPKEPKLFQNKTGFK
jgi:predicted transcriptional regulator